MTTDLDIARIGALHAQTERDQAITLVLEQLSELLTVAIPLFKQQIREEMARTKT